MLSDLIASACARPKYVARFWSYVDKSGDCWIWRGARHEDGYGHSCIGRRLPKGSITTGAHRISWTLANGRLPDGAVVCHKCDNPPCVNPAHLFLGTPADNERDCREKGRKVKGETHWYRKLTEQQVREIRALGGTMLQREIGALYGISQMNVGKILSRKAWKHVA